MSTKRGLTIEENPGNEVDATSATDIGTAATHGTTLPKTTRSANAGTGKAHNNFYSYNHMLWRKINNELHSFPPTPKILFFLKNREFHGYDI